MLGRLKYFTPFDAHHLRIEAVASAFGQQQRISQNGLDLLPQPVDVSRPHLD
jgi:hypothetical protein